MIYIAFVCLGVSVLIACVNVAGCIVAAIKKSRGTDQGYTCIPLISFVFSSLAWALGGPAIGPLAMIPATLDPGTWMLVALPFGFIEINRSHRKGTERQIKGIAERPSSVNEMDTTTALRLLGPLASLALQRRFLVEGTSDRYILPEDLINSGDSFLNYPRMGKVAKLPSIQEFSRILNEAVQTIPLDDPMLTNRMLVEQNTEWDKLRSAAKNVLEDLGAHIDEWERQQLEDDDV